jgi:hypothetical protein
MVHLIIYSHHKPDCALLFLCLEAENVIKKKGVWYHVDCCAAKADKFSLVSESHINPDMRVKIPAAMMTKGYSNKESKNRTLQMQVCREVEKIRGLDPPRPPALMTLQKKGFDVASKGLVDPHAFSGGGRDVHEFHCRGDAEHVLVGFIVVSHLFVKIII